MDWIKDTPWFWWVAAAIVLALVEMLSLDFFFVMLGVAALAAALAALLGASSAVQVMTFIAAALVLLVVVRPLAKRRMTAPTHATNTHALVGREALVLSEVSPLGGLVKLAGEEWSARSADGSVLAAGEPVHVTRIDGATAVVETRRGNL